MSGRSSSDNEELDEVLQLTAAPLDQHQADHLLALKIQRDWNSRPCRTPSVEEVIVPARSPVVCKAAHLVPTEELREPEPAPTPPRAVSPTDDLNHASAAQGSVGEAAGESADCLEIRAPKECAAPETQNAGLDVAQTSAIGRKRAEGGCKKRAANHRRHTAGKRADVTCQRVVNEVVDLISDDDDECEPVEEISLLFDKKRVTRARKKKRVADDAVVVVYNPHEKSRKSEIVIRARDYNLLEDKEFLNDTLIDFYFKMLGSGSSELLGAEEASRCFFFSSLFIRLVMDEFKGSSYQVTDESRAHQWATNIPDLFQKDFLLIPVHQNLHWSLALVCFAKNAGVAGLAGTQQARVVYMDSLGGRKPKVLESIRKFLDFEWKHRHPDIPKRFDTVTCQGHMPTVPVQSNDWDCGLFVLQYAQMFARSPAYVIDRIQSGKKKCLENWFEPRQVEAAKRTEVQNLLNALKCQEKP